MRITEDQWDNIFNVAGWILASVIITGLIIEVIVHAF